MRMRMQRPYATTLWQQRCYVSTAGEVPSAGVSGFSGFAMLVSSVVTVAPEP